MMGNLKGSFYWKNKIRYCAFVAFTITDGLANLAISALLKEITDVATGGSLEMIKNMCLWTLATLTVISVSSIVLYYVRSSYIKHAVTNYKKWIMDRILGTDQFLFFNQNSNLYLSSLTNDIFVIETDYLRGTAEMMSNLFYVIAAIGMMIWYSPLLTAASILLMLIPITISALSGGKLEREVKNVSEKNVDFVNQIQDILKGFPVIKSFRAEYVTEEIYSDHNQSLEQAKYRKNIVGGRIDLWSTLGSVISQLGILLIGAYLAATGKGVTAGILLAFVSILGQISNPISRLPGLMAGRKAAGALIEKAEKMVSVERREEKSVEISGPIQTISLQNVSFAYAEHNVLEDISLQFEQGKSYAVVGESGSGKSTLLNLIMAYQDAYSGRITYDNVDARTVKMESIVNHISEIQQNVFIFNATVWDNVTMFQEFSESEVSEALEKAGLSELIANKGKAYLCGEGGCNLSGGEKQRISIARSFLKKASVFIADEVTAALDAETSFHVMEEILRMKQMTRIVVSHDMNLNLLKQYDQIIVMKNGEIQEQGSFEELMERKEYFYSLYNVANV